MSSPSKKPSTVVVVRKDVFSVVYKKKFDETKEAYDHSVELREQYNLEEYNIVLTLEGTFDILRYLDTISKRESFYMN